MPVTDPLDMLDIASGLSDEEIEIQRTVARFLADRARPHIAGWFDTGRFPRELIPELGKLGVLGMHLNGYGCAGTNAVSYGLACLEWKPATADSAASSPYRARCRCSPSTATAPKSRSPNGCPSSPPATPSGASG